MLQYRRYDYDLFLQEDEDVPSVYRHLKIFCETASFQWRRRAMAKRPMCHITVGTVWGLGEIYAKLLCITLTFQKVKFCVQWYCDFKYPLSYERILALLLYTESYIVNFKLFLFGWQNIPPCPPVPTTMCQRQLWITC